MLVNIKLSKDKVLKLDPHMDYDNVKNTFFVRDLNIPQGFYKTDLIAYKTIHQFSHLDIIEKKGSFSPKTLWSFIQCDNPRDNHGLCNNAYQIIVEYTEVKSSSDRYIVLFTEVVDRSKFTEYKWGKYLGEDISVDPLYIYHIYKVKLA